MRLKRLFDLTCALLGITVLSPLLLLVALWIKLDSPGPVFFRQVRVGRHGKLFRIFKFRTMRWDLQEQGRPITVGDDPRVTRAGRFLRKYKLDELPQLFNVVAGDMSLVGPRPEVPEFVRFYPEGVRDKVLSVLPGITDLASIEFRKESEILGKSSSPEKTYVEEIMPVKLEYYERYVEERSFLTDLRIVLRTLWYSSR